jgi:hypothetical protein
MDRSRCSRSADLSVHDGPMRALKERSDLKGRILEWIAGGPQRRTRVGESHVADVPLAVLVKNPIYLSRLNFPHHLHL